MPAQREAERGDGSRVKPGMTVNRRPVAPKNTIFRPIAQVKRALAAPEFIVDLIVALADVKVSRHAHAAADDDGGGGGG